MNFWMILVLALLLWFAFGYMKSIINLAKSAAVVEDLTPLETVCVVLVAMFATPIMSDRDGKEEEYRQEAYRLYAEKYYDEV